MLPVSVISVVTKLLWKKGLNKMNRNKTKSINNFFRAVTIFPIVYFVLFFVISFVLVIVSSQTGDPNYLYLMIGFTVFMLIIYIAYANFVTGKFQNLIVHGLYDVTANNFKNISDNNNLLELYPNKTYQEFLTLNEQITSLKTELDSATLISGSIDYSLINLEYIDKDNGVVTFESFKNNLEAIVFASQNYRNVLIELFYETGGDSLNPNEIEYLTLLFRCHFTDYDHPLYILPSDNKSIYLYLPRIDSLSKIREQLETMARSATVSRRTPDGITNLAAHFAVVCYPFSDLNELFTDLAYAKRQNESVNFYLPNRLNSVNDNKILKNSMNLNIMSKLIAPLLNANLGLENSKANLKEVQRVIEAVRQYFDLDYAGIISYDEIQNFYYISYQSNAKDTKKLSRDSTLEKEFIHAMDLAKDENNSYYFALRNHANNALGRHLDRVGLESGFFYVLKDGDLVVGAIYFFNKEKTFGIDSYIQEAFVVLCDKIAAIILGDRRDKEVESSYNEIDAILKITDYATYRVSHDDFSILRYSTSLASIFPKAKYHAKCYKAFYGLDEPCPDCPLLTGNKKTSHVGKNNYETSLILSELGNTYHILTMKNIFKDISSSRYHSELVINSYTSLLETLENSYAIAGKGYVLLLRIDNMAEMIEKYGSEKYLVILRDFIRRLKKAHNSLENVYYFNTQFLALLFTEYGQTDILDECENIYALSAADNGEEENAKLRFTYLPVSYPRTFPNATALLKQAEIFSSRGKHTPLKDFIYFDESSYTRSANREEFLLSVIKKAFGDKTFNVNLQPMVNAKDKTIFGAELLLRITDDYRNTNFRTDELVNVAAQHNQIGLISHALLDYIASLYVQYGVDMFNMLYFKRLSLNTDYSFFTDGNFYRDTHEYIKNLNLPNDFLAFEIPESDVSNHLMEFRNIARQLKSLHIPIVCDQYTGRFVSIETLSNIGFNEVKISRNVINHIDSDRQQLENVRRLLEEVKEFNLRASIVGVENIDQYLLLKDIDENVLLQGFYFYRPLEKQGLIDAVRDANKDIGKKKPVRRRRY